MAQQILRFVPFTKEKRPKLTFFKANPKGQIVQMIVAVSLYVIMKCFIISTIFTKIPKYFRMLLSGPSVVLGFSFVWGAFLCVH